MQNAAVSIRINSGIYNAARWTSEFWARIGRAALDNPDLPVELVRDILISKAQDKMLAEKFTAE